MIEKIKHILAELTVCGSSYYVAGGCLTSIYNGDKINDVDLFFESKEKFDLFCSENDHLLRDKKLKVTPLAITILGLPIKLQLFTKFFCSPEDMIYKSFDFHHCMVAYIPSSQQIIKHEMFEHCASNKIIRFNFKDAQYSISSLYRIKKLLKKGYDIDTIELVKLALHIKNLKIESFAHLSDQIEGLDTENLKSVYTSIQDVLETEYSYDKFCEIL